MKKISIRRIFSLILIVFVIGGVLYINSPRYIIKRTVMWYERDFTIPVFCKKVRFEYDRKTGNYTGKFKISEHQSEKIIEKLDYCKERGLKAYEKNSIVNEENLESLSPGILNCTYVWTLMLKINYEKHEWEKREYVDGKKLYPEEWMIEDDAQILEIYTSHPQRWGKYTLYKGKDVTSYITIYKNSKNEYYFCIKYTDFSDWDGIKMD
ncbi:MAG TPA: hypothetical protein DD432_08480 [Eubacterium sp.]|nr:hypothetical protein [Eubacterium sp.]